jgi:hypothetical protein
MCRNNFNKCKAKLDNFNEKLFQRKIIFNYFNLKGYSKISYIFFILKAVISIINYAPRLRSLKQSIFLYLLNGVNV